MYGYIADHNWGRTLLLSDGRVFERREQPGGSAEWYLIEEGIDIDLYAAKSTSEWGASWTELDEEMIREWIDLEEAKNYYIGEPPRNRR